MVMKKLPVGALSFEKLRNDGKYYVDKTPFIKTAVKYNAKVLLITRPRRFGKSLFMDAIFNFLKINSKNPGNSETNEKLFSGLKILEDQEFCDTYMGQYPVISLTLKDVKDNNFISAYQAFAGAISKMANKYYFLLESPRLNANEKETFDKYTKLAFLRKPENSDYVKAFLENMILYLSKHFQRKVIVLIDEYDVPLSESAKQGYYGEMLSIVKGFLGQALKPDSENAAYLKKAILTGCLRVGKESIFTDFNNPAVNTVCSSDPTLTEAIGFTYSEVKELLRYYGLESRMDEIQRWYDGYRFGDSEMYCPWDIINFCAEAIRETNPLAFKPKNYWINTSGNEDIDDFLGFLSGEETDKMQTLVDGGEIEVTVNETLNYGELKRHEPRDFWTMLLFTGYLTIAKRLPQSASSFALRIPNEEIRATFIQRVQLRFSSSNTKFFNDSQELATALIAGDVDAVRMKLNYLLQRFISIRDRATRAKAENFYHGFLLGIFTAAKDTISSVRSNTEARNGYADILFTSADESTGVILEVKISDKREDSIDIAKDALAQIENKGYGQYFCGYPCKKIQAYGIVFFGKDCNVLMKTQEVNLTDA